MIPLRFQLSCGKSVKYRYIEFFVFDCGSLLYLLSGMAPRVRDWGGGKRKFDQLTSVDVEV